jgi:hypothetical protein
MTNAMIEMRCDGCGQLASPEHVARRLEHLEWATRYHPIHISALFLGASAPHDDAEFLYAPEGDFDGEAEFLLQATGLNVEGKTREAAQTEFQRAGFFLAHVLECPFKPVAGSPALHELLEKRLPFALSRIRRSLKPKSVIPISRALEPLIPKLQPSALRSALILDGAKAFPLDGDDPGVAIALVRAVVTTSAAARS